MSTTLNFKLAGSSGFGSGEVSHVYRLVSCCDEDGPETAGTESEHKGRARLQQLHSHMHCSIIGTCLGTTELRKVVSRLTDFDVSHASDLELHHEGVTVASDKLGGKALTKLLDKRHEAVIQAFSKAKDSDALTTLWQQALQSGAIPGAYWAVMSHRHATPELRQRAFGEVHMLSHLVGAANRADIKRLAALELENSEWRERAERQQVRIAELHEAHDQLKSEGERLGFANVASQGRAAMPDADLERLEAELLAATQMVALQTQRREAAERSLAFALAQQVESQADADRTRQLNETLTRELHSAELHLQALADPATGNAVALVRSIAGWKVLYVGGRPSSTPAIRKLVIDSGAQFVHHDGGMEDRKGLLASALTGASIVVFPVDCVDHDSVTNLKRLCARHDIPFVPVRTASVTSFASALTAVAANAPDMAIPRMCLRHG
jgi:hypothetical protein